MKTKIICALRFIQPLLWKKKFKPTCPWLKKLAQLSLNYASSENSQVSSLFQKDIEISFLFCDNATIQHYNFSYRGQQKSTNVLSFPSYFSENQLSDSPQLVALGDVMCAFETICQEAEEQKKTFEQHLTHLVIHGILHLLGFDHEEEEEAAHMETLESQIIRSLGFPCPYRESLC